MDLLSSILYSKGPVCFFQAASSRIYKKKARKDLGLSAPNLLRALHNTYRVHIQSHILRYIRPVCPDTRSLTKNPNLENREFTDLLLIPPFSPETHLFNKQSGSAADSISRPFSPFVTILRSAWTQATRFGSFYARRRPS